MKKEFKDDVCEAFKQLITEGKICISVSTYPGRGWIDIRVKVDGVCIYDEGCAI